MNDIDAFGSLDARSLRVLLCVLEERSVSGAADRLGVTQSAVSHTIEKLRGQFSDPLFVRDGRGIAPTSRVVALEAPIRRVLHDLRELVTPPVFDPGTARLRFTVAANDFQRDLLLPELYRRGRARVAGLALDIVPSGIPRPDLLRKGHADLLVTPHPPDATDLVQRRLLRDRLVCFYDAAARSAPRSRKSYLAARHITLRFSPGEPARFDLHLASQGVSRNVELTVSNFSAVPSFMRGTDLVATLPSLLGLGLMGNFAWCEAPVDTGRFAMYMVWHERMTRDPAHRWLREQLLAVAADLPKPARSGRRSSAG